MRYFGASLGYQLGAILEGGAMAPLIATALWSELGTIYISIYISIACLLALISVKMLTKTHGTDLDNAGATHLTGQSYYSGFS